MRRTYWIPAILSSLILPLLAWGAGFTLYTDGGQSAMSELDKAARVICVSGCSAGAGTGDSNIVEYGGVAVGATNGFYIRPGTGATFAVTGPLTDAELRAVAVPVSGTVTATGPLTDTQLRATAVPVSGTFWQATQPISNAGTFATQVDGDALTALQLIDNMISGTGANISQINGVTPLMGIGASGTGSPRVTLASDSSGPVKVWDGSETAEVKAATTSAGTADPSFVVAQSPNPSPECTSIVAINQTASATVITGTASQFIYICSIVLVSATAQNLSLTEGTGTVCATGEAAVMGGTTASIAVAANGGFSSVAARPWLKTATAADGLCLEQSGAGNVSGIITYKKAV